MQSLPPARRLLVSIAAGLVSAQPLCAQSSAGAVDDALRTRFRETYLAAAPDLTADDDAALETYVLYPYLVGARIARAAQETAGPWQPADAAAAAFLTEHGSAPVSREPRRAWLARRGLWNRFLEHYDASTATPVLECQALNARIAEDDLSGLGRAVSEKWLTPQQLPAECETAFRWLRAEGLLTDALTAERVALLLDRGQPAFARTIARRLPDATAGPLLEHAAFIESPARMLDTLLGDSAREVDARVVADAWSRLARDTPEAALTRFAPLAARMASPERVRGLTVALALGLAWDRRPEALDYFARVPAAELDDDALEWRARAGLWAGEWDFVAEAIARMSSAQRGESAWRYWAARAAEQRGERGAARALYATVVGDDNYYSAMAAARLGDRVEPALVPLPRDAAKVAAIAALDTFQRAHELALAGLRELATYEWQFGYAALPEDLRVQAIHVAADWALYDVAVATATRHGIFNDYTLLYPRPYLPEIASAAARTDIESTLLFGLFRQESLFRPDAASPAAALGVAQLQYATARTTAARAALALPSRADLFDPATSVAVGAARLAELLAQFDAELPVALAAYNAGAVAAARWLPGRALDSDIWIENIPYNETRAYVRRVLWHSLVYAWLERGRPQSARGWLGEIKPP